jgi:RNA polymerase sigma factor (sigma-70 family)
METVVGDSDTVEDVAQSEAWQRVQDALLQLPLRAQYIIQQRFFGSRTLEQVGNTVGVSKERVRQIQRDSIEQLRELLVEGTPA